MSAVDPAGTKGSGAEAAAPEALRAELKEIIRRRSYRQGEVITLASGRTSDFYFDMKPTMLHPRGAVLIAELMLDAAAVLRPDCVGGLEMGAVPIVSALAPASERRGAPLPAFFVRKTAKDHGTGALIEGLAPGESLQWRRVLIVEDVTTTGGSALKAAEVARAAGADVVGVLTIVDRGEGAGEALQREGLPFIALFRAEEFRV